MRGRDLLDVADFLTALETEASCRSQISRIYYGAYLEARQWCEENLGYTRVRLGREHGEIARLLKSLNPSIEEDLAFLRAFRNTADYDLHVSGDTIALQREESLMRADRVLDGLYALSLPNPGGDRPDGFEDDGDPGEK